MGRFLRFYTLGVLFLSSMALSSCDLVDHRAYHDPVLQLQKEDYAEVTQTPEAEKIIPAFVPKPQDNLAPPPLTPQMKKPVSLSIQENTPLRDVFSELSKQAGVGLALSPELGNGGAGLMYSVKDQPFIQVIKDLCDMSGQRFQIKGNLIHIEPDSPYLVTYNVQFLSQIRTNENRISSTTQVFSAGDDKESGADNGSDSILKGNSTSDFWAELEQNLQMILYDPSIKSKAVSPHYSFHRQGGLLNIKAKATQHQKIVEYIKKLREATATQVLIEAKIVEVKLHNEYRSGINWNFLGDHVKVSAPLGGLSRPGPVETDADFLKGHHKDVFSFAVDQKDFSSILKLVNKFGTVRTLSNPRLTVMNNQSALLKVATNEVFFTLDSENYFRGDGKPDIQKFTSSIMTTPVGMILSVQPSVNHHSGDITMTLRPTITRIDKFVLDPAVSIESEGRVESKIPVVQIREIDSVLRMKSGQVLVLGGLMEDHATNTSSSVPGVGDIPLLGEFARGKDDERHVTELVIFLTAHIADEPIIVEADERLYNVYMEDPRPLDL